MSTVGIYRILNMVNGKMYIGSSKHIEHRLKEHFKMLQKDYHSNLYLQHAYNKYGAENFKTEILEIVEDITSLATKEREWINHHDSWIKKNGYNILDPMMISIPQEVKEKISKTLLGRKLEPFTEDHKNKIGNANRGKRRTEEQKHFMSQRKMEESKKRGRVPKTEEHKRRIGEATRRWMNEHPKKTFIFIDPNGTEILCNISVAEFCRQHGLCHRNISDVLSGKCSFHKGWSLKK